MNQELAERLYRTYFAAVYGVCFLYMRNEADACDAVQETFLRMLSGRFVYESDEKTKAWLIVTASNVCRNSLVCWWRRKVHAADRLPEPAAAGAERGRRRGR